VFLINSFGSETPLKMQAIPMTNPPSLSAILDALLSGESTRKFY
jgi:hypothetical protein